MLDLRDDDDKARPGASRLAKLVLTETAHAIWKTRCERVIGQPRARGEGAIEHVWFAAIDNRLLLDQQLTRKALAGTRRIDKEVVLRTWAGVVERDGGLPEEWTDLAGVLVGRRIRHPEPHTAAARPRA